MQMRDVLVLFGGGPGGSLNEETTRAGSKLSFLPRRLRWSLVMRIREAAQLSKQALSEAPPEPATSILYRRRRASSL